MEFLDVFKEYRQVSKEAFEISLQFLISPLFSDQNAVEEKKKKQNKNVCKKSAAAGTKLKTVMVVMISQCPKQDKGLSHPTQIFVY